MRQIFKKIAILPVRLYQWIVSPLFPPTCRHTPTCSNYTVEAINEWGALKGVWLGLKRLSKCHPWGTQGYDPVPKKGGEKDCCDHHKFNTHQIL